MRRIVLLAFVVAGSGLFFCGCGDDDTSNGRGAGDGNSSRQPDSQPAWTRPAAPVVIESVTTQVDVGGGAVGLSNNIRLEFPPGAIAKACEVTVKRIDPKSMFRPRIADRRIVLDVTCGEKLRKSAQIRIPLPKNAKTADDIIIGHLSSGGVITVNRGATINMTSSGPELVAPTNHFSVIVITFAAGVIAKTTAILGEQFGSWLNPPPDAVDPSTNWVPVFCQGQGPECLATSAQMACKAIKPDAREIWRLMARSGIFRSGLSPWTTRFLGSFSAGVKAHSGVEPTIYLWQSLLDASSTPYLGAMKRYIMRTLGEGIPVVFGSSEMKDANTGGPHAVILLGYDKDGNFYGVNPQFTGGKVGVVKLTQKFMGIEMSLTGVFVTMALPVGPDVRRPKVTLNVLPNSAWFLTDKGGSGPAYMLTWDGSCDGGIGWRFKPMLASSKSGPVTSSVPPEVATLRIGYPADKSTGTPASGGVDICNTDDRDHNISVLLELHNTTTGTRVKIKGQDGLMASATVAAHKQAGIPFLINLAQMVAPDIKDPQQFELRLELLVEGYRADTAIVPFTLDVLKTISTPFSTRIKTQIPGHGVPVKMTVSGQISGPQYPNTVQVKASDRALSVIAPRFFEPTKVTVQVDYDVKTKYRIFSMFPIDKVNTNCQVDITLLNPRLEIYPSRRKVKKFDPPAGGKVSTGFFMPFKDGVFGGSVKVVLAFDQKLKVSKPIVDSRGVVVRYDPYKTYTQELDLDAVSIIASPPRK